MATKAKSDVKVLKGQEAEDKVLEYVKMMNRPYGAVDVSANLKGAVPKTATQKILVALAEKGELVQKTYGKTTFFVANQAKIKTIPAEQITALETEYKKVDEESKQLAAQLKTANVDLAKLKATPSDVVLDSQINETRNLVEKRLALLEPLRSGSQLISAENLAQVDADWAKWRSEWIRRKKIFMSFWQVVTDSLPPSDAEKLAEELGIEFDTPEHVSVERGPLCNNSGANSLKRKR